MPGMGYSALDRFTRIRHPVAREEDLLVEHLADETVVYDTRTKEAHCLSPLAAAVFAHCDGRTTVDQLAALAAERIGEPVEEPRVIDALSQLHERDLLAVPPRDGLSRRQMIGKSAAAGGALVGASLITTILAPTAAAQGTQFCTTVTLCRCCAPGRCTSVVPGHVGDPCASSGSNSNCCDGKGCNCTGVAGQFPHCKPANAGADLCLGASCVPGGGNC